jgi:adenylate cyclase
VSVSGEGDRLGRLLAGARRLNRHPALVGGARRARHRMLGDEELLDRLSTARGRPSDVAVRELYALRSQSPGVLGEVGLTALQVWQRLAESQGRGRGEVDVAVLFTDLAGFSSWALEAGDESAIRLLRRLSETIEPPIVKRRGKVVKRLGDGLMGAFGDACDATEAAFEAHQRAASIEVEGYRPRLRTGIHLGRPRRVGGDYLGVDVNIAARLAEAADPDEILLSGRTLEALGDRRLLARRRRFSAPGTPVGLRVYAMPVPGGPQA